MWYICHDQEWEQYIFEAESSPGTISEGSPFTSVCPYKTLEELMDSVLEKPCVICGAFVQDHFAEPRKSSIIKNNMCFHCDIWYERSKNIKINNFIVDGNWYTVVVEDTVMKGFGGAEFQFMRNNSVTKSNNVWYGGKIPKHFLKIIPNNAIRIK